MENKAQDTTISQAIREYLEEFETARAAETVRAYRNALHRFCDFLRHEGIDPDVESPRLVQEQHPRQFLVYLKQEGLADSSRRLYLAGLKSFLEYLTWEGLAHINMRKAMRYANKLTPKTGYRLPRFPKDDIEKVIGYAQSMHEQPADDQRQRLIDLRDRAFILTLADTGLRVHEACKLRRGDMDWNAARAVVIGKGDKQAIVRFSRRAVQALKDYLAARREVDAKSGKQLSALPLFLSHNNAGEKKALPISTKTGRAIVKRVVRACLGADYDGEITPHTFRHYFVTSILLVTGDIYQAQKLARHSNISTTEQYGHLADQELDATYRHVFDR